MDAPFQLPLALDLAATLVFAATGALAARSKGFDVVGVAVLGLVTGLGGALLRDGLFLQAGPPIVIRDGRYLAAVLAGTVAGAWFAAHIRRLALPFQLADAMKAWRSTEAGRGHSGLPEERAFDGADATGNHWERTYLDGMLRRDDRTIRAVTNSLGPATRDTDRVVPPSRRTALDRRTRCVRTGPLSLRPRRPHAQ